MSIEQPPEATSGAGMEEAYPRLFIASATGAMSADRSQAPDVVSDLDVTLRAYHEALPRATPKKVDFEVSRGKRQAVLGSLTQIGLNNMLEQAVLLIATDSSLVDAGLPGPGFCTPPKSNSKQLPILRSIAGSSETFLLTTMGWLHRGYDGVLSRAENPDDDNHPLWVACQATHKEFSRAVDARYKEPFPEFRKSLRITDQATAITTGQLLVARAVSYSRSRSTYPTGAELTRSALQAADQLSWIVGGTFSLTFKFLHAVNWLGKFSAFEAAEEVAAPELFTETPDLFNTEAANQWRLEALSSGPLPLHERGYCPLDVSDEDTPPVNTPQIVEDFIGIVEDRYDLTIPRGENPALPGSTAYVAFATLLGEGTIYAAWRGAMQRNAALQR